MVILNPLISSMLIILFSNIMTMDCFNWYGVSFYCILRVSNSNFLLKTTIEYVMVYGDGPRLKQWIHLEACIPLKRSKLNENDQCLPNPTYPNRKRRSKLLHALSKTGILTNRDASYAQKTNG